MPATSAAPVLTQAAGLPWTGLATLTSPAPLCRIFQSKNEPEIGLPGGKGVVCRASDLLSERIEMFERGGGLRGRGKLSTLLAADHERFLGASPSPSPQGRVPGRRGPRSPTAPPRSSALTPAPRAAGVEQLSLALLHSQGALGVAHFLRLLPQPRRSLMPAFKHGPASPRARPAFRTACNSRWADNGGGVCRCRWTSMVANPQGR